MKMKIGHGRKNELGAKDKPLLIITQGWEIITNNDVLKIIEHIFMNEDAIYPRPKFLGASMFMNEIIKIYAQHIKNTNDNLKRHGIDPKVIT